MIRKVIKLRLKINYETFQTNTLISWRGKKKGANAIL